MHVLECTYNLNNIALYLKLMQSFSPTKDFIESLISTELKEDVNIVMVFKEMLKPHDVFVLQGSVNFDLGKKLE